MLNFKNHLQFSSQKRLPENGCDGHIELIVPKFLSKWGSIYARPAFSVKFSLLFSHRSEREASFCSPWRLLSMFILKTKNFNTERRRVAFGKI